MMCGETAIIREIGLEDGHDGDGSYDEIAAAGGSKTTKRYKVVYMLDRPREQHLHRRQVLTSSAQFVAMRGGATTKFPIAFALWPSRSQGIGFERGDENWHSKVCP
jgi:hypothetical protein